MQARQTNGHRIDDVHLFVCLSVCLSPKCKKRDFLKKLSNLELWYLLTTCRKLCKLNWAFQRTHYWNRKIQDGGDPPSWKSTWRQFFLPRVVRFGSNFADWCRRTRRLRWYGRNRNQKYTNIAVVWANLMACYPRTTCHILHGVRIPSAILKIIFRHILFSCFNAV